MDSEIIATTIREALESTAETDRNFENANVVDGLFAIARAIHHLARAVEGFDVRGEDSGIGDEGSSSPQSMIKANQILTIIPTLKDRDGEDGATIAAIATEIGLSEQTVSRHAKRLISASVIRSRTVATSGRPKYVFDVLT